MTEDHACATIMRDLYRRSFCMPRFTPLGWWECDVLEITPAGYFREYEVKLSQRDFELDAAKFRPVFIHGKPDTREVKHALLAAGDIRGPSAFSFVAPAGLIPVIALPLWAGLIELSDRGENWRPTYRYTADITVLAPTLHRKKADPAIRAHAISSCYYRYHAGLKTILDRTSEPLEWKDEQPPTVELEQSA